MTGFIYPAIVHFFYSSILMLVRWMDGFVAKLTQWICAMSCICDCTDAKPVPQAEAVECNPKYGA